MYQCYWSERHHRHRRDLAFCYWIRSLRQWTCTIGCFGLSLRGVWCIWLVRAIIVADPLGRCCRVDNERSCWRSCACWSFLGALSGSGTGVEAND